MFPAYYKAYQTPSMGTGTFDLGNTGRQKLINFGYGKNPELACFNMVYNPAGAFFHGRSLWN